MVWADADAPNSVSKKMMMSKRMTDREKLINSNAYPFVIYWLNWLVGRMFSLVRVVRIRAVGPAESDGFTTN